MRRHFTNSKTQSQTTTETIHADQLIKEKKKEEKKVLWARVACTVAPRELLRAPHITLTPMPELLHL